MRKLLALLAAAWIGVSLAAAWVSVDRKLPYDLAFLDRAGARNDVGSDWLTGWGTGLAVPMWAIAAVAVLTTTAMFTGAAGRFGAFLLSVAAGGAIAHTLANQPATDRLRDIAADGTAGGLVVASLALAGLLVLVGLVTWVTTPNPRFT